MRVLIVDDSRTIRRIVGGLVKALGFAPAFASNGVEALDTLDLIGDEVGLVLMDWNMPEMDGLACLKAIRVHPVHADQPVMMLTTESEAGRVAMAIRAGASNYCTKPFTPETLGRKILECLGKGEG